MDNNFSIRVARKKDLPIILSFIKKLAVYEKMEDQVIATEKSLKHWLFNKKVAKVIFAVENGKEVGFALYFFNFSTFVGKAGIYLEDLFVLPEYRGKGFGKLLLKTLAQTVVERDCGRLEWSCLTWNKPSIDFYQSLGAKQMDEWRIFRLTGKELENLAKE